MAELQKCQTISVTIIAYNEESNLPRCLSALKFADEVIVIDSESSDRTAEIAQQMGARVIQKKWMGYGAQKNFAMLQCKHDWVLNVDADEVITPQLRDEILQEINSLHPAEGYAIARKTYYLGQWIRYGGWYPNYVTRLVRKSLAKWTEPQVHEVLKVSGELRKLKEPMLHYTFRSIADQIRTNVRYAEQGAEVLFDKKKKFVFWQIFLKPVGKFFETFILKKGFLDGFPGFVISINAAHSMFLKFAFLYEKTKVLEKDAQGAERSEGAERFE